VDAIAANCPADPVGDSFFGSMGADDVEVCEVLAMRNGSDQDEEHCVGDGMVDIPCARQWILVALAVCQREPLLLQLSAPYLANFPMSGSKVLPWNVLCWLALAACGHGDHNGWQVVSWCWQQLLVQMVAASSMLESGGCLQEG